MQMVYGEAYMSGELIGQDKQQMHGDVDAAEVKFRSALHSCAASLEWRSMVMFAPFAPFADFVAHKARSVDVAVPAVF